MANTAIEEWERLNRAVNCKHYIGTNAFNTILEALKPTVKPKIGMDKPKTPATPKKTASK